MTKYQISGSTVSFTNDSTQKADVDSWEWLLDTGSGYSSSGVNDGGTPEIGADITFPSSNGTTCHVKLVAHITGFPDEEKIETYVTVQDIDPPVISTPTVPNYIYPHVPIEIQLDVNNGTGAGDLTWAFVGGDSATSCFGLDLDQDTGIISGFYSGINSTAPHVLVQVTDALGRVATKIITLVATSAYGLYNGVRAALGITKDASNIVSQWNGWGGYAGSLTQNTTDQRPTFIASDSDGNNQPCVLFEDGRNSYGYRQSLRRTSGGLDVGVNNFLMWAIISIPTYGSDTNWQYIATFNSSNYFLGFKENRLSIYDSTSYHHYIDWPLPFSKPIIIEQAGANASAAFGSGYGWYINGMFVRASDYSYNILSALGDVGTDKADTGSQVKIYEIGNTYGCATITASERIKALNYWSNRYNIPINPEV